MQDNLKHSDKLFILEGILWLTTVILCAIFIPTWCAIISNSFLILFTLFLFGADKYWPRFNKWMRSGPGYDDQEYYHYGEEGQSRSAGSEYATSFSSINDRYYDILGITRQERMLGNSDLSAIVKARYRLLAKTWHPDRFTDPSEKLAAENKFKMITEAYREVSSSLDIR